MSKVMFVGDCHFSPRTPVSRKDDYPETLLNKLDSLVRLCMEKEVKDIVFLGDLINNNQMTMEYFIKLYKKFLEFVVADIKLHTVIGNHDIQHGNPEFLDKSPMSILLDSGLFSNKDFIKDNVRFKLVNYYDPLELIEKAYPGMTNIFIGHFFYLSGFGDMAHTLSPDLCKKLGYDLYLLGHDHTPYEPLSINGYEVHRPGSFSRATSDTCQVNRDEIRVCIFDTKTHKMEYKNIPNVLPSKDIYKESKLLSKLNESSIDISLSEDIDNLINSLTFDFSSDIYKVLDDMNLEEEVKRKAIECLDERIFDGFISSTSTIWDSFINN